ncbi:binding partner of ACD11 1-like isoform X2 [Carex rostrata]
MSVRTVKVSNLSHGASEQDIREFFSFSGEIEHVEMQGGDEWSQIAYVTFKDAQGADTALLLSGATIVDMSVIITAAPEYKPPPSSSPPPYVMFFCHFTSHSYLNNIILPFTIYYFVSRCLIISIYYGKLTLFTL